ncbi:hypothetical protein FMUND_13132 [Fusarium mundagurra]|uniref:Uncharacterized protein n=1 Tax=Fusarium mundagurra TaxID=1567541 RepID=A0A8H5Y1Q5_9HYPO|nr:hypothetical protein FMUND_13132 [Fusarium mundagurra]
MDCADELRDEYSPTGTRRFVDKGLASSWVGRASLIPASGHNSPIGTPTLMPLDISAETCALQEGRTAEDVEDDAGRLLPLKSAEKKEEAKELQVFEIEITGQTLCFRLRGKFTKTPTPKLALKKLQTRLRRNDKINLKSIRKRGEYGGVQKQQRNETKDPKRVKDALADEVEKLLSVYPSVTDKGHKNKGHAWMKWVYLPVQQNGSS